MQTVQMLPRPAMVAIGINPAIASSSGTRNDTHNTRCLPYPGGI
jgi:hypothetical protein